jgi:hypothetical protein
MEGVVKRVDPVEEAARTLYAVAPDDFMARRAQLSAEAREAGDGDTARAIDRLRKPTLAAWIVNALVFDDPSVVDRLSDIGGRLRSAQDALDAATLRDLSTERRALVASLTKEAFQLAERADPGAGLRDEVSGTFDAAIAEPEVAERLGRLQRSEQWSGFGFGPSGAPELTLVRGGRGNDAGTAKQTKPTEPKRSAVDKRRLSRALSAARDAFEAADSAFDEARSNEQELSQEVRRLTKKLAKLQSQLDTTRAELEAARKSVTSTRGERREARSAFDRAQREAGD